VMRRISSPARIREWPLKKKIHAGSLYVV